jgi:2-polyprenylphenol 6-hydroxylase
MQKFDVLIVGGGMVGLTMALALRQTKQLSVAVVEQAPLTSLTEQPELRVSALNLASVRIFENLAVWPLIDVNRCQSYQHMHVWDKAGAAQLNFDHAMVKQDQLGWIVENNVLRTALWQKVAQDSGIVVLNDKLTNVVAGEAEVFASFEQQAPVTAKLAIGADGANSWLRKQMQANMLFRDYDHHAIVATVDCSQGHQNTAWQVFLAHGPLAFLPLFKPNLCSIVWSTTPQQAEYLGNLSERTFNKELTAASDGKLGNLQLQSERIRFPLTMRLAQEFNKPRMVLIGDAAHTIHPLAGQGVNLGLLDAASLAQIVLTQAQQQQDIADVIALNKFSRWRKSEAVEMIAAMEALKQVFTVNVKPLQLLRGLGVSLLEHSPLIKPMLIKQAFGQRANLPQLAKLQDSL